MRTTTRDDGESIGLFEPLIVSQEAKSRPRLNELALTLVEKSAALSASLPEATAASVADIVRTANCYYSNLIEGHDLNPINIERAMHDNFNADAKICDLQLEARAHIRVQQWIDDGGIDGEPFSAGVICQIHRRFCELLPPQLLLVGSGNGDDRIVVEPGRIRTRDVKVGRHVAISPGAVSRFLARMEQGYKTVGQIERVLIAACGHHRLLWVHPFLDGNGRVARLASHAALRPPLARRARGR